jgi:MoxR-like ATPase
MLRLTLGYPAADVEAQILEAQTAGDPLARLEPVLGADEVLTLQAAVGRVRIADALRGYVVALLTATRESREVYLGASPRAGIALVRAAKALALLRERDFVVPQDVKDLAVRVLGHRIILAPDARVHGLREDEVIAGILQSVPAPRT